MKYRQPVYLVSLSIVVALRLAAQEAEAGLDLRATISLGVQSINPLTNNGKEESRLEPGLRATLYPTIKLSEHWSFSGALQLISHPYDRQDFQYAGRGIRGRIMQANLGYSLVRPNGSITVRAGQMTSAFGSFLLRYDDAENPLINTPRAYGYYYNPVATIGLAGIQTDITYRKWDGRLQLTNSSPTNPRSIFDKDQYGNWTWGAGYSPRQGLHLGASGYRGPYLDRHFAFYLPGEAKPSELPAKAIGVDADWAVGHWNICGEWQRFVMPYRMMPDFRQSAAYLEARRSLSPRWFIAARAGYLHSSALTGEEVYEASLGFRPNTFQQIKLGYTVSRQQGSGTLKEGIGIQLVTTIHPLSVAWR